MLSPLIVILLLFYALLVATALLVWLTLTLPRKRVTRGREGRETPSASRRAPKVEPQVTVARPAEPATGSSLERPLASPRDLPGNLSTSRPTNDATRGAWAKRESGEAQTEARVKTKEKDKEDDPFERFVRSRRDDLDL